MLLNLLSGCGITVSTGTSGTTPSSTPSASPPGSPAASGSSNASSSGGSGSSSPSSPPQNGGASGLSNSTPNSSTPPASGTGAQSGIPTTWTSQQWVGLLSSDLGSVVKITTYTSFLGGGEVSGSGFFTHGVIITCNHVVANAHYFIDVWLHGGSEPFHARVVATDPAQDLAALQLDNGYDPGNLMLGHMANQSDGESVAIVGHPGGGSLYITPGTLLHQRATINVSGYGELSPMLQMQTAAIGGDSGGPVFDTNGNIIGVLEDGSPGLAAQGGAVPVSAVRQFLQQIGFDSAAPSG